MIDAAFKGVGRAEQLGPPPGTPWHDPAYGERNATYDPAAADALLDELHLDRRDAAGYRLLPGAGTDRRLTLLMICSPGEADALQFLIDDWREVGLHVALEEKPHRLFLRMKQLADMATGQALGADTWDALGAGSPYFYWYYAGGMHDAEASHAPGLLTPDDIELEAMRLGQRAGNAVDPAEKAALARQVMHLAAEQVWAISVTPPGPAVAMVKEGLLNVPPMLRVGFEFGTPDNAFPELWYWEKPGLINGEVTASQAYADQRRDDIVAQLTTDMPAAPGSSEAPVASAVPAAQAPFWTLGRVLQWLLVGIVLVGGVLLILRHPFVLRRLAIMVPTLAAISVIVYVGVQLPPGSYLDTMVEQMQRTGQGSMVQARMDELEAMYHLDEHPVVGYLRWTGLLWFTSFTPADQGLLQGYLGRSMANNGAFVNDLVGDRLLLTMAISGGTILFTWIIALPIGIYSAVRQYSPGDYALTVGGFIGMCIPDFVLALVLMLISKSLFGVTIDGLFSTQYAMQQHWDPAKVRDLLQHIWVPILVIGTSSTAWLIRVMRANLLDELRKPYVTTARAKGVRPVRLLIKYPVRLALNPFIAGIGGIFPALVSGGAIVAIILSLPTVGPLLLNAVMLEDTYMASSLLMCLAALSVLGVLVSDLLLMALDPRIRLTGGRK